MANDMFGISEKALKLCEDRALLLTSNLANSSTPNYKARDINFQKLLQDQAPLGEALATDDAKHLQPANSMNGEPILYRTPMQKSMDGNTVDEEIERKSFLENAIHYQVNLTFIQSKANELIHAIKGE